MPNIALIVAMRSEMPNTLRASTGIYQTGKNIIGITVSGIGPKRARRAARRACGGSLGFQPDILINCGFCGAVGKDLNVGHLVVADRLAHRDQEITLNKYMAEKAAELLAGSDHHIGKLQTFNWPVLSRSRVGRDVIAVDMESFAVAQSAAKHNKPLLVITAVSDVVPEHISLVGLMTLAQSLRANTQKARARLSKTLKQFFRDQELFI